MSDFLKNKQIIITIAEITVVIGVCYYFSRKNKELVTKIEILAKKFEEQQQLINRHEEIINHLIQMVQEHKNILDNFKVIPDRKKSKIYPIHSKPSEIKIEDRNKVSFNLPPSFEELPSEEEESESELEEEPDIDEELREELQELNDPEEDLKKENLKKNKPR
jgi:hypothetical protein